MKKTIDIFCDIIDNFGDIGIVYRLSKDLSERNFDVRIFVNKLEEVSKIVDGFDSNIKNQKLKKITFVDLDNFSYDYSADIIIEAFAIDIPQKYLDNLFENTKLIINLEYLTAEDWALDCHLKPSFSPKANVEKYFYIPGFVENSGGIILDNNYLKTVEYVKENRETTFNDFFLDKGIKYNKNNYYINVFTYNWDFEKFIESLKEIKKSFVFFILDKRVKIPLELPENIKIYELPFVSQENFDILINLVDFNFSRGEDSVIRSILSEKPFIWNIYPQEEDYHLVKLEAYLDFSSVFFEGNDIFYRMNLKFNKKESFTEEFLKIIELDTNNFSKQSNYIRKNCDLVTKLLNFIDSKLKN